MPVSGNVDTKLRVGGERWSRRRSREYFRPVLRRGAATDRIAVGVHHAIAGADDRLRIDLISEADAWSEVLVVVVDRGAAVAGVVAGTVNCSAPLIPVTGLARLGLK